MREITDDEQIVLWQNELNLARTKISHINAISRMIDKSNMTTLRIINIMRSRINAEISRLKDKIWKIRPELVPEKTKPLRESKGHLRLNSKLPFGEKAFIDFLTEGNYESELDPNEKLEFIKYAVRCISKEAALMIDLKYNKGYSNKKIAEIRHCAEPTVSLITRRALKRMKRIVRIMSFIHHLKSEEKFSFDKLLEECSDIFTDRQIAMLSIMMDPELCIETYQDIFNHLVSIYRIENKVNNKSSTARMVRGLKAKLLFLGIPEKDVNSIHYLMRAAKPKELGNDVCKLWSSFFCNGKR